MASVLSALLLLAGCSATRTVPPTGTDFELDGCTPFLNCVSSESSVSLYNVPRMPLTGLLTENAWKRILSVALDLPGATLDNARFGYAQITCYSDVFGFPDYLEILVTEDGQHLQVRSQSLLGFYDLGVNRDRVETLRVNLQNAGLVREAAQTTAIK
ncbi:DUF1499 domain-containing protein [Marinobacter mangrovi]|uniref:DUF1499 domain-containing protein n=1 Tax=Marinobacter mangrovi TaxID=2803918 RepID=UPI0019343A99|nr:DUF1499 domain-containing protein [Marinobacter mangrovi]